MNEPSELSVSSEIMEKCFDLLFVDLAHPSRFFLLLEGERFHREKGGPEHSEWAREEREEERAQRGYNKQVVTSFPPPLPNETSFLQVSIIHRLD